MTGDNKSLFLSYELVHHGLALALFWNVFTLRNRLMEPLSPSGASPVAQQWDGEWTGGLCTSSEHFCPKGTHNTSDHVTLIKASHMAKLLSRNQGHSSSFNHQIFGLFSFQRTKYLHLSSPPRETIPKSHLVLHQIKLQSLGKCRHLHIKHKAWFFL